MVVLDQRAPWWQRQAHRLTRAHWFEMVIVVVIVLNALTIGLGTYPLSPEVQWVVEGGDLAFQTIFVVELTLRLAAHRFTPLTFFRNPWNVFDFLVVSVFFIPGISNNATALRLVRLARVSRLIKLMPDIRVLAAGLRRAAGPAFSLLTLTVLLCYLYAIVGWIMFHDRIPADRPQYFSNLGESMLTLFELLTLEGWNSVLHDLRAAHPLALPYVISFLLFGTYIIINLVVGVVITSLDEAYKQRERERSRQRASLDGPSTEQIVTEIRDLLEQLEAHLPEDTAEETRPVSQGQRGGAHRPKTVQAAGAA